MAATWRQHKLSLPFPSGLGQKAPLAPEFSTDGYQVDTIVQSDDSFNMAMMIYIVDDFLSQSDDMFSDFFYRFNMAMPGNCLRCTQF